MFGFVKLICGGHVDILPRETCYLTRYHKCDEYDLKLHVNYRVSPCASPNALCGHRLYQTLFKYLSFAVLPDRGPVTRRFYPVV